MTNILLLASSSASRKKLLEDARIPFKVIGQSADESKCDWGQPLQQLVESIALYKMEHAKLPAGHENAICYVLTADTLSQDSQGTIEGKPTDRQDAIHKIKKAREGMFTGTAFVLDKKVFKQGIWQVDQRITQFVGSQYRFNIPDAWLEQYLENSFGLQASGAIAIEGYGSLFLESVHGSYTTIVGLPIYQVREALEKAGFFR